jgi:hypothetical protein
MKSLVIAAFAAAVCVVPCFGIDLTASSVPGSGIGDSRQSFCDPPSEIQWLQLPNYLNGLASSTCFAGVGDVKTAENFTGNGSEINGVGFWWQYNDAVPAAPRFFVRIYERAADGCPGTLLFEAECDVVVIGSGDGSIANPIEYFCDFGDNGSPNFLTDDGVAYSLSIQNDNCPTTTLAYWATAVGDGVPGCVIAPDFGIPDWDNSLYPWDFAFYLCTSFGETPVEETSWTSVKALYR